MTQEDANRSAVYEIGYLLVPTLSEEEAVLRVNSIKEAIGGEVIAEEAPKMRDFSYEMGKSISNKKNYFNQGFFGWFKLELPRDGVSKAEKLLSSNDDVVRFLLIETVRESTMAPKRSSVREGSPRRAQEGEKISEEEIDKSIEALVKE